MTILFYPGQEDYITELNKLAAVANLTAGEKGWSPVLLPVADGPRLVLRVADWTGGAGGKPASGKYLSLAGLTSNIAEATDIRGTPGVDGVDGTDGTDGASATVAVGTVTTGAPGSSAIVTNSGTTSAAVLDFTLPQGPQGAPGTDGADGVDGAAATISVGTVTTGAAGSAATVTNVGTSSAAIFNFTIPRGADGAGSGDVTGPASSTAGHVAVFSDSTGKALSDGGALGTAAFSSAASFATASQGALADSAVQPEDLATVATSGSYNDLTGKPTIPAAQVNSDWSAVSGVAQILNKPTIPAAQVNTDWNAVSGVSQILNKPAVIAAGANATAARTAIGAIPDAASDGKTYGRKGAAWVAIATGSSSIIRSARTSNTQLTTTDRGALIDITSGTFTQTFAAAATLTSGWYCYIRNSGTGDITLDPNASETIDGLTSYVMYPREVRLIQCDGTVLRSVVLNAFNRKFTTSETVSIPPGYGQFSGLLWGGGGGGSIICGGGGGACNPFTVPASFFSSTAALVIGAGGAASTDGGNSTFAGASATIYAYGGGGGGGNGTRGGGGGGVLSAGTNGTNANPLGGNPSNPIATGTESMRSNHGFGGGHGGDSNKTPGDSAWGGGGGGSSDAWQNGSSPGGSSLYGGGGGGSVSRSGGTSLYGGSGGAGETGTGVSGNAPGGGGGGGTVTGSSGARGELCIWGVI